MKHPTPRASAEEIAAARARSAGVIGSVKSWVYKLAGLDVTRAAASPYDLLVVYATTGVGDGGALQPSDFARLKRTSDDRRRLVVSHLSIGEAEDYRPDYFSSEYLEEDAPDWLMRENPQWKGNRIISFCDWGWRRTILGDDNGSNVYNSIEPSPLNRLVEVGLDGVYPDRADVYSEVGKACPDAARWMVAFAKRLAVHARWPNPDIFVFLQNAKVLFGHRDMIEAIEAIAKEDLFYGINHDKVPNPPGMVRDTLTNLAFAARSGLKVFVVEYLSSAAASRRVGERISVLGYLPLITERGLGTFDHTPQDVPANPSAVPSPTPKPHPSDARGPRGWQRPLA